MEVIVKNSDSPKFKIHYNREMGKKYYTAKDYYSDLKARGCEPYKAGSARKRESTPYTTSTKAMEIMKSVSPDKKGNIQLGDRAVKALKDMGVTFNKPNYETNISKGGFA